MKNKGASPKSPKEPASGGSLRLLILCSSQFGYHLDTYYYCKHGREVLDITYMGFEGTRPPVDMEGVRIKPVAYRGNKLRRFLRWWWTAWRESRKDYDVVFVKYFPACSLIRLLTPGQRFVFDVRTGSITKSRWRRRLSNALLKIESWAFTHVTVISESLARLLGLRWDKVHLLPLGADVLATNEKRFDGLHLLYVGTLNGREIDKTILGFERFHRKHKNHLALSYAIAGDGHHGELDRLRALVADLRLDGVVDLLGFVHHADLAPFWEKCNLGVSFIPINEIYDVQPATKTFEYLLAGMPVIATGTAENKRVVSADNGIIIPDTAHDFNIGLEQIFLNRDRFTSAAMRQSAVDNHWETIVKENLCPYLAGMIKDNRERESTDV